MPHRLLPLLASLLILFAGPAAARTEAPTDFSDWAVAIVAGDWRSSRGQPIQAFDNAVRDLKSGFIAAGFRPANIDAFTLRPDVPTPVTPQQAAQRLQSVAARATGGCLLYFTSHGSPQGIVFGTGGVDPRTMAAVVQSLCGQRPTVVVVSACFSGVFIDSLAAPNRMVMTAARRDRSSFGCSEDATHPYFDGCIIQSLPQSGDFLDLAARARRCVAERETAEGLSPPSEPQLRVGAEAQLLLPFLRFSRAAA
ncbi:C13 family peptidase [Brevundimonas sp. 2R-24]|uniref:C13 family peptidase n=1 Tax=Peiella sedimenti TaxID=3061083 RepID=A0ABT8SPT3_9CAUL|nr:C13 family peptidase [Caulobacteraceae bacterium XZ-24]